MHENFMELLVAELNQWFKGTAMVRAVECRGNNSCVRKAVQIRREGTQVAPSILADVYEAEYKMGLATITEIAERIFCGFQNQQYEEIREYACFEYNADTKKRIRFKLVSYEKNKEMLESESRPWLHLGECGLAIVFFIPVWCKQRSSLIGTIEITNDLLNNVWKVDLSAETLFQIAKENISDTREYRIADIKDILGTFMEEEEKNQLLHGYVAGNENGVYGAGMILLKEMQMMLKDILGASKAMVVPLSVHVTVVDAYKEDVAEEHRKRLKESNRTQVAKPEFLSGEVMVLDLDTGVLSIYDFAEEMEETKDDN